MGMMLSTCRHCGCDELHPCWDEHGEVCRWVQLNLEMGEGLCSVCAAELGLSLLP